MEESKRESIEKIRTAIHNYVEGVINFDFVKAKETWHSHSVKQYYNSFQDKLEKITMIQSRPDGKQKGEIKQTAEIKEVDATGDAAIVKLEWDQERDDTRIKFIDYISLLKIKIEWKIVAKIFNVEKISM